MTQYERYRAKGLCGSCGKKLIGNRKDKSICATCQSKNSKYIKDNIKFYKEHNLCPRCGKEALYGQEKACPECRAKAANYNDNHPKSDEAKAKNLASNKRRSDYRRANNLCVDCGVPISGKYATCERCRFKRKAAAQKCRDRKKYGLQKLCAG